MPTGIKWLGILALSCLLFSVALHPVFADHDSHDDTVSSDSDSSADNAENGRAPSPGPANNQTYNEECGACHTTAGQGIYEDDNVRIPK